VEAAVRTYAAFLAGASKMRWLRFLVASASGGIARAAAYAAGRLPPGEFYERLDAAFVAVRWESVRKLVEDLGLDPGQVV
jgi:uncharacterized membrane protein YdjX (TVP38/TMEM64 family)